MKKRRVDVGIGEVAFMRAELHTDPPAPRGPFSGEPVGLMACQRRMGQQPHHFVTTEASAWHPQQQLDRFGDPALCAETPVNEIERYPMSSCKYPLQVRQIAIALCVGNHDRYLMEPQRRTALPGRASDQ